MALVSIITPVFNGAGTIGTTMESLFGQVEEKWEHIIIDDGSKDRTGDIVLANRDPRIKYYREPKCGRSIARNIGIAHAAGEFLLFLDADDWLLPNALQEHTTFLKKHAKFGVSVSDGYFCTSQGKRIASLSERRGEIASGRILERLVVDPGVIGASNAAVIRSSLVKKHGLRFQPGLATGEDWLFWIEASGHTPFGFIPAVTCAYRWHGNNTSLRTDRESRRSQLWAGRQKVMNDPEFVNLTEATRKQFFYQLLTDLLRGKPEEQEKVFKSPHFDDLPNSAKSELFRLTANEYLLAGEHIGTALKWLEDAGRISPTDLRNSLLEKVAGRSPKLAGLLVRCWRTLQFKPARESLLELNSDLSHH